MASRSHMAYRLGERILGCFSHPSLLLLRTESSLSRTFPTIRDK